MHRFIIGAPKGVLVDHKNGDGLDNRRENLRFCSASQNQMNRGKTVRNKTGFKGVFWGSNHRWQAQISCCGIKFHLGSWTDPEDAAAIYDIAAQQFHGKFARLNFPERADA